MLSENQIEMNGYRMGAGESVAVLSVVPKSLDSTVQDVNVSGGDNRLFGRDYIHGRVWDLSLRVKGKTPTAALAAISELVSAWDDPALRVPGVTVALRYERGGRTRLVYGRPRDLLYNPDLSRFMGRIPVTARFVTSDLLHYDDVERLVTVDALGAVGGGLIPPFTPPALLAPSGPRSGVIPAVGGDAPAPVTVTVEGPTAGPVSVSVGGSLLTFTSLSLAFDQSVTVDTRRMTVLRNDGASLAGLLSRRTFLPDVRLRPGPAEVVFTGPVGARCIVRWRPAHHGF